MTSGGGGDLRVPLFFFLPPAHGKNRAASRWGGGGALVLWFSGCLGVWGSGCLAHRDGVQRINLGIPIDLSGWYRIFALSLSLKYGF